MFLLLILQLTYTPFGTASQSSIYGSGLGIPQNAINPPISNDWSFEKCSTHTHDLVPIERAWWMFNISFGSAYITDVTIYYREACTYT